MEAFSSLLTQRLVGAKQIALLGVRSEVPLARADDRESMGSLTPSRLDTGPTSYFAPLQKL